MIKCIIKYTFFLVISLVYCANVNGQCVDFYGSKVDCPTESDSLVIYNNALKVFEFYENSKLYRKTRTRELNPSSDGRSLFDDLATARRMFFVIRRELLRPLTENEKRFTAGKPKSKYKDISYKQYYQEIDEYRFYQRELENQIVNVSAPMSMFDTRISPILVNEYLCIDTSDVHAGDLVNIPLYIPVTVKPFLMLTESELAIRNEILKKVDPFYKEKHMPSVQVPMQVIEKNTVAIEKEMPKVNVIVQPVVKKEITPNDIQYKIIEPKKPVFTYPPSGSIPVYYRNNYGSGHLIGFFIGKKFRKILPTDEFYWTTPKNVINLLNDNVELEKWIRLQIGDAFEGFYN